MIKPTKTRIHEQAKKKQTRRTLYVVRGHPGSGKSSVGILLAPGACYAADDWFDLEAQKNGKTYAEIWNPDLLDLAHRWCRDRVEQAMICGMPRIAVTNVFRKRAEIAIFRAIAAERGYTVVVVRCENDFENVHGVPSKRVASIKSTMEDA
jgi:predicted kinase